MGKQLIRHMIFSFSAVLFLNLLSGCASGGGGELQNENGSDPINDKEMRAYKRAVLRCSKMGGTRVVKIRGKLLCF